MKGADIFIKHQKLVFKMTFTARIVSLSESWGQATDHEEAVGWLSKRGDGRQSSDSKQPVPEATFSIKSGIFRMTLSEFYRLHGHIVMWF